MPGGEVIWHFLAGVAVGAGLLKALSSRHQGERDGSLIAPPESIAGATPSNSADHVYKKDRKLRAKLGLDDVYNAVEDAKRRAYELGLPDMMARLAPEVRFWPSWIERNPAGYRDQLLELVRSAETVEDGSDPRRRGEAINVVRLDVAGEAIEIFFRDYRVYLEGIAPCDARFADAELIWNGERVLSVQVSWDVENNARNLPLGVNVFVEGPWIEILRTLDQRYEAMRRQQNRLGRGASDSRPAAAS